MTDILHDVRAAVSDHKLEVIADESREAMQVELAKLLELLPHLNHPAIREAMMYEHGWRAGALWATVRAQKIAAEVFAGAVPMTAIRQAGEPS